MKGSKTLEIKLEGYGDFFGTRQGTLLIRDKNKKEKTFPLFENEIGSVILKTGNLTSVGALATCSFWGIDVLILTSRGNPVVVLKSIEDDSYVQTRVNQYQALENGKGREIGSTPASSFPRRLTVVRRHLERSRRSGYFSKDFYRN
jgi:CRISPR/Cas system-associated endonuclease Cas1